LVRLKGPSPTLYTHTITSESEVRPRRDPQWRLNPPIIEVVQKEILKLLNAGVIYPIEDFDWVSPTHVVPKKGR